MINWRISLGRLTKIVGKYQCEVYAIIAYWLSILELILYKI